MVIAGDQPTSDRGDRRGEPRGRMEPARAAARDPPQRQQRAHRRRRDHHDRRQRPEQLRHPRFEALRYDPAADTWSRWRPRLEERGYHSTALLLPDGRVVSAGDDGPSGGGGSVRRDRGLLAALPVQGRPAHDHLGARAGRGTARSSPWDVRRRTCQRRAGGPGRDHPRQRHAPAAGAARMSPGTRRLRPHRPRHRQHRPAGLLHALPGQQRRASPRWRRWCASTRPAAARHHPAQRGRLGPGGRRHRLGHHPGERQRLRRRRRGRGPVHPRRGQPGRRGHQRPLLGQLEHHHRLQRRPHPARDRPRRRRQLHHLDRRRRDRSRTPPAPPTGLVAAYGSRRPRAPRSPTPRARATPARSSAPRPAPPRARSAGRSTSTGSTTTSRWPTPTRWT